jgi:hypothetical protein
VFWNSVFAQALAGKLDPVSVVNEAVEDGVGECWIADHVMPAIDRHLAGDERRRVIEAILDDFEQVAGLLRGEGFRPPIIQDEQFDPAEAFEQLAISPVATRQGESTKEAWNTLVKDGDILPAGLLAESAGKPAFAGATRSCDDEASPLADPVAGGELEEQRAVETARGAIIDVFDAGGLTKARRARPRLEAFFSGS